MKMRPQHIVSLARQDVQIFTELESLTNRVLRSRPMSENAVLAALRRMGYTKE